MNIYLIELKTCGYDEYDSWVVSANNEEEVISSWLGNSNYCSNFSMHAYQ